MLVPTSMRKDPTAFSNPSGAPAGRGSESSSSLATSTYTSWFTRCRKPSMITWVVTSRTLAGPIETLPVRLVVRVLG